MLQLIPSFGDGFHVGRHTFDHAFVIDEFVSQFFDLLQSLFRMIPYAVF